MISLASLRKVRADKPPRLLIYGPPGIGKTTLASEFPDPVFIQVEDGTPGETELTSFGRITTYRDVLDALGALYMEEHGFKTVVIDSATELQKLIYAETCARGDEKGNAKANIEDFGYGKGYVYAMRVLDELLEALNYLRNERGMAIVLIAHSSVQRFDDPESVSYDRYEIALRTSDKANADLRGAIEREMDGILLLKKPVSIKSEEQGMNKQRAIAGGADVVMIHTVGRAAFVAKNRYGIPAQVRYDRGKGYEELAKYLPAINGSPAVEAVQKEAA